MPSRVRGRWISLTIASVLGWSSSVSAELSESEKDSVRLLANDAAADYGAGRYPEALDKFTRAYRIAHVPKLALWLAKTELGLGHFVKASELCLEATRLERNRLWVGSLQQTAQRAAEQLHNELQARIARVSVRVQGVPSSGVSLSIDNVRVPNESNGVDRLVDPGIHTIVGQSGAKVLEVRTNFAEGERKEVALLFTPGDTHALATPATDATRDGRHAPLTHNASTYDDHRRTQQVWGWVGLSIGAAGILTGTITGVAVALKHAELSDACPARGCGRDRWSELDNYDLMRRVSSVGFAVGAISGAIGLGLLLSTPTSPRPVQLGWWIAPSSAGVAARF